MRRGQRVGHAIDTIVVIVRPTPGATIVGTHRRQLLMQVRHGVCQCGEVLVFGSACFWRQRQVLEQECIARAFHDSRNDKRGRTVVVLGTRHGCQKRQVFGFRVKDAVRLPFQLKC